MKPSDLERLRTSARDLVAGGRHAEAGGLLHEALHQEPHDVEVLLVAAETAVDDAPEQTVLLANRAGNLGGNEPGTLLRSAGFLLAVDDIEDARGWLTKAADLIEAGSPYLCSLLYLLGRIALADDDGALAVRYLTTAFEEEPEFRDHGYQLVLALQHQQRWDKALAVAESALKHHPGDEQLRDALYVSQAILYGPESLPAGVDIQIETSEGHSEPRP